MIEHGFWDWSSRDSYDWFSIVAGLLGLFLTILAIVQAKGAKKAATDAKEAIWNRAASEYFQELAKLSERLVELMQLDRIHEAAVRARDILAKIPLERTRFERFLGADSGRLEGIQRDFERLSGWLADAKFFENQRTDDEIKRVVEARKIASRSSTDLTEIYGRLIASLERNPNE
jgi:hypothetical protein